MPSPIRIAIVNDYEIVVRGLVSVLAPHRERVLVVEIDARLPVASEVDVLLYDTFGQVQGDAVDLEELTAGKQVPVVVFSWNLQPDLVRRALQRGAAGYLAKSLTAEELVTSIEAIHAGKPVTTITGDYEGDHEGDHEGDYEGDYEGDPLNPAWPGLEHGLSAREAEVIALITQGMSNQEIADRCYLSINSVKTYVRTAYRKMSVTRRSQAVLWGLAHGFEPDRLRDRDPLR